MSSLSGIIGTWPFCVALGSGGASVSGDSGATVGAGGLMFVVFGTGFRSILGSVWAPLESSAVVVVGEVEVGAVEVVVVAAIVVVAVVVVVVAVGGTGSSILVGAALDPPSTEGASTTSCSFAGAEESCGAAMVGERLPSVKPY